MIRRQNACGMVQCAHLRRNQEYFPTKHMSKPLRHPDCTRQTINAIESGDYNPTINLCVAICKALGKSLDELFWEEGSHES